MHERLLEGWLDSASERSYQGPFCQVLAAEGYIVIHSTRHGAMEFGKDVIARDPDGVLCAYQLKGNPGSRLTLIQFREIQGQLWQLATQSIILPGVPPEAHRAFLVTNGNVDEEVQRSIDDMNRKIGNAGSSIELITRGNLLAMFGKHAGEFWPTEIADLHRLFQLLAADGNGQPPLALLHGLLGPILLLDRQERTPSAAEVRRRITSAAFVLAVGLRSFSVRSNYYSVIAGWVLYATYVIAACERYGLDVATVAAQPVGIARESIQRALLDLAQEAAERKHHVEGHPLVDAAVYRARRALVAGLLAVLWLWCEREGAWPQAEAKESVKSTLDKARREMELWGEGAIPQYLAVHWYVRATDATMESDAFLALLLHATTVIRKDGSKDSTLASPYYSFEDVMRHQLAAVTGAADPFEEDTSRVRSYFAEAIFHLLVRTGLKPTCKDAWSDLTRVPQERFEPAHPWGYCLWRSEEGRNVSRHIPIEGQWASVIEQARCIGTPEVPVFLRNQPELLLLFTLICPHRATPNVVRYLGRVFSAPWFVPSPIESTPFQ